MLYFILYAIVSLLLAIYFKHPLTKLVAASTALLLYLLCIAFAYISHVATWRSKLVVGAEKHDCCGFLQDDYIYYKPVYEGEGNWFLLLLTLPLLALGTSYLIKNHASLSVRKFLFWLYPLYLVLNIYGMTTGWFADLGFKPDFWDIEMTKPKL